MDLSSIIEKAKRGPLVVPAFDIPGFGQVFGYGFYRIEPRVDGNGLDWYWFATESEANQVIH